MRRSLIASLLTATVLQLSAPSALAQKEARRSITPIAGNLYRFQNNFHFSVFYVTDEGIIATDPINADAAQWLKTELGKRFDRPVRYLIYSHDHRDHIAGGEVFADTATVVAHRNARRVIIDEQRPTAVPDLTFTDSMRIELGGKTVELTYVGRGHSDNSIVMSFPEERALFAVDFIPVRQVAWRTLADAYVPDWMDAIARVEAMDFDVLVPGHGPLGTKADATAFRGYMQSLYDQVLAGVRAGKTLDELKTSIRLESYAGWFNYEKQLQMNIEGMYARVVLQRRGN